MTRDSQKWPVNAIKRYKNRPLSIEIHRQVKDHLLNVLPALYIRRYLPRDAGSCQSRRTRYVRRVHHHLCRLEQ